MMDGKVFISRYKLGWLFDGTHPGALSNLTFKAPQWREHIIQETSDVLEAHYCDGCGAVTIETNIPKLSTLEPGHPK